MNMVENLQIQPAFLPVDMTTAANTGDWINLRDYKRLLILFIKAAGQAADDPTITLQQATSAAGASAKPLTFTTVSVKQAATDLTATGTFTRQTQAAAATYTNTSLGAQAAVVAIEVRGDDLDVSNAFSYVQASVAKTAASQLGCVLYLLGEPRYASAVPPSAIA